MVSSGGKLRFCTILLGAVLLKTDVVASAPSPSQLQVPPREPSRQACSFGTGGRMYNISDLLQCMNELASSAISQGSQSRAPEDTDQLFSAFPGGGRPYPPPFPPYPGRPDSDSFPPVYDRPGGPALQPQYQGPPVQQPEFQPGPGFYPPPPGAGYPNPLGIGFNPAGGSSINLFDALSSISQYDDHKCVPRLLCEVATGVVPGSGSYKQASSTLEDLGKNTLIGLLTALDLGETSPALGFAKSALLGYTSKGNPSVCYQEYVKCPRNPDDLVHYLNNHNGGFFRFFSNIGNGRPPLPQGSYPSSGSNGYGLARKQPAPPPGLSGSKSDRTGTGELRFDNPVPSARQEYGKSFFPELRSKNETTKFVFPSSKKISNRVPLNRVSKSLTSFPPGYYSDGSNNYQNEQQMSPPFFPQDGKDQDSDILYQPVQSSLQLQNQNQNSQSAMVGKARLYMSDSLANTSTNSFTFPDGQKVKINVAFSKLFTDGYRKTLRRSFSSEQVPHPTSFDGFNMMNLANVFPEDKTRPDLQIGHPCDMICHDARGTPVQFSQAVSNTGSLNTLMSPDRPILDLSRPVPCEVMCVDRKAERRRSSTVLSQVLRPSNENTVPLQDMWQDRKMMAVNNLQQQFVMQFPQNFASMSAETSLQALEQLQNMQQQQQLKQQQQSARRANSEKDVLLQRSQKPNRNEKTEKSDPDVRIPKSRYSQEGGKLPMSGRPRRDNPGRTMNAARRPAAVMGGIPYINIAFGPPVAGAMPQFRMGQVPIQGMMPPIGMMAMPIIPIPIGQAPVAYSSGMINPCARGGCPKDVQSYSVQVLTMCGGIIYLLPPNLLAQMPICAIKLRTSTTFNTKIPTTTTTTTTTTTRRPDTITTSRWRDTITTTPTTITTTRRPDTITTPRWRDPGGTDYPSESCLIGESWNFEAQECVPIRYDREAEAEYTHVPGVFANRANGITKRPMKTHRGKKKKKLIIITDQGNITYVKAT